MADSSDTLLIGRGLTVDHIPYWQDVLTKPDDPMHEVAERFVASPVKEGLIDEFHLFVSPVVLGQGVAIFDKINSRQELELF